MSSNTPTAAVQPMPSHPDLEQYKKQARELLNDLKTRRPKALERLKASAPHIDAGSARLADAHFVIAREHGFASWPKFKTQVELRSLDLADRAHAFTEAAVTPQIRVAEQIIGETPTIAQTDIYAGSAYGDLDSVRRLLDAQPGLARIPGGPRQWVPLLYACFSRFIRTREDEILSTVRLLLDRDADPNASYTEDSWTLSALYGACGQLNNPKLANILIDAGANVNDGESLYHSVEFRDHACTRLLLERGARINEANALKHMLDYDDLAGLELLLHHGADPNHRNQKGETALHWALFRHRTLPFVERLVDHGADVNARRNDGITAYRMASRLGKREIAEFLERSGADTTLDDEDRKILAAISGQTHGAADLELGRILADAAETADIEIVRNLLDLGVSPNSRGSYNGSALHLAAWYGHSEVAKLLIERGADIEATGADLGTTPMNWAAHGADNNPSGKPEDYIATIDTLLGAGADANGIRIENKPVREHMESRMRR